MPNPNKIGALWVRTSKGGRKYMSGEIEIGDRKYYITVFKNDRKEKEKQPDYNILLSQNQPAGQQRQAESEESENLPF